MRLQDPAWPRGGRWGGPGRRLPPLPPPGPGHTAGSHYLPSSPLRAPRAGGVSAAGGGVDFNQSQAGNSSRGARPGCGSEGAPGAEPGNPPAPPSSEPAPPSHPASWKLGLQPTPALRSTFLPLGAGGARRPLSALLLLWDKHCAPTPTTPDWAHLLRGLGSGAGPATPRSIPSALRNGLPFINSPLHTHTLVVITLRWALAGRSRAEPGLRAPSSLPEFRPSASCLSDTIVPILQVKAVRFGQRKGWWSRSSGRLAGQLPGPR